MAGDPRSWAEDNPRPGKRHRPGHTGKRRFKDEISAKLAVATAQRKANRDKTPCRAYHCDVCQGWHLTSRKVPPKGLRTSEDSGYSSLISTTERNRKS